MERRILRGLVKNWKGWIKESSCSPKLEDVRHTMNLKKEIMLIIYSQRDPEFMLLAP